MHTALASSSVAKAHLPDPGRRCVGPREDRHDGKSGVFDDAINALCARYGPRLGLFQQALAETPTVLVMDGVVHQRAVRREGLTPEDLEAAARTHGLASMDEIKRAVPEIDGSISVIPANQPRIRTQPDLLRSRRDESRRFDARTRVG